ncbi:hypothetical protein R84B8_02510 [Treponema sp. R8-4-B8]
MKKSIWWISDDIEKTLIQTHQNYCEKNEIIVETLEEFSKSITPDFFVVCSVVNIDKNYDEIKKIIENNPLVIFHFIYRLDNDMLTFKESNILKFPNTKIPTSIEDLFTQLYPHI